MRFSITIVTAVRDAIGTLGDCLTSVQAQSIPLEHVLIDGASTDGTLEILRDYRDAANDNPERSVRLVSEPDEGLYDAINKGIRLATGEIVGILNADDFYAFPKVLEHVRATFGDPGVDVCYADLDFVDRDSPERVTRRWRSGTFSRGRFWWGWMPPHPTFFVRRSLYEQYDSFRTDLGSAADYELMLRFLVKHEVRVAYLPEVLIKMRTGGVSTRSLRNRLKANRMDRRAWTVNGLRPYPWTICVKPLRKVLQFV